MRTNNTHFVRIVRSLLFVRIVRFVMLRWLRRPLSTSPPRLAKLPRRARRLLRKDRTLRNIPENNNLRPPPPNLNQFWETFKSNLDKVKEEQQKQQQKTNKNTNNQPKLPPRKPNKKIVDIEINLTQLTWAVMGLVLLYSLYGGGDSLPEITFAEFKKQFLNQANVSKLIVVNKQLVKVIDRSGVLRACFTIGSVESFESELLTAQNNLKIAHVDRIPVVYTEQGSLLNGVISLAPTLMFLAFLVYIGKRAMASRGQAGGVFGVGKTKAQLYNPQTDVKIKFDDVAGMQEAKTEIMEFVQFLKTPEKYLSLGAKIPRGAILSGAPGTGKTLLAKATAGEADVPFFSVSGSEFVEMFSGVGASRVRDLFKKAKEKAPSMIWIDEIDAIGKARAGAGMRGGNDEREATLNQLLVEMDGFGSDEHVIVLAGTNRPDMLDKALLRPGRFDRHINIDLPTLEGRKAIYEVHLSKIKYDTKISELSGKLAAMTPGFSGADIANCCNEAALAAARSNASLVEMSHFEQAIDRVIAGLERRSRVLPKEKRKIVAYHEAGHAVAGWFLKYADPLMKVTIVPHGAAALGYAQLLPSDQTITTENRMRDLIVVALGGRCSEELFFNTVTVGASDDFKRITQIAKGMVCDYGFSKKIGSIRLERQQGAVQKPYSEQTDQEIDQEVFGIINESHERCKTLLSEKRDLVEKVAQELLEKEQLTRQDLVRLLGERPFKDAEHEAFKKYVDK